MFKHFKYIAYRVIDIFKITMNFLENLEDDIIGGESTSTNKYSTLRTPPQFGR